MKSISRAVWETTTSRASPHGDETCELTAWEAYDGSEGVMEVSGRADGPEVGPGQESKVGGKEREVGERGGEEGGKGREGKGGAREKIRKRVRK